MKGMGLVKRLAWFDLNSFQLTSFGYLLCKRLFSLFFRSIFPVLLDVWGCDDWGLAEANLFMYLFSYFCFASPLIFKIMRLIFQRLSDIGFKL